jgi:large subunit ribosomal protein L24
MKFHIKKNDTAVILAGKDRGKQGKVLMVDGKKRVATIEGLNLHKKHTKQNPQMKIKGGILEHESPIPLSRLAPWCAHCKKPARVGRDAEGKEHGRICRSCEKSLS